MPEQPTITIAVPKGRVLKQLIPRFAAAGVDTSALAEDTRKLIREDKGRGLRFLLLKPDDVPTYVEYGVADLGVVGRDVLWERGYDLYAPVDLDIGRCRLAIAGLPAAKNMLRSRKTKGALRVATKFRNMTTRHFAARGQSVEIIYVQGSVELAPLTGLADCIVDLVESGETLRQNGLR